MPYVEIKPTSSTRNATKKNNHQKDVIELEIISFKALGELVRRNTFKNIKMEVPAWAGTVKLY